MNDFNKVLFTTIYGYQEHGFLGKGLEIIDCDILAGSLRRLGRELGILICNADKKQGS